MPDLFSMDKLCLILEMGKRRWEIVYWTIWIKYTIEFGNADENKHMEGREK